MDGCQFDDFFLIDWLIDQYADWRVLKFVDKGGALVIDF